MNDKRLSRPPIATGPAAYPLQEKLGGYVELSPLERRALEELHLNIKAFASGREVVVQGGRYDRVFILCRGVAFRFKILWDGRRQILNVALPGDMLGFPSCLFEGAINSVACATPVSVAIVPLRQLLSTLERFPRISMAFFWASSREAAMYGERLIDIGRRSAEERLGHMLLEMLVRLRDVGLADQSSYRLPLTQEALADALGLSGSHVSRSLRSLREKGLLAVDGRRVTVMDIAALSTMVKFDPTYLSEHRIPGLTQPEGEEAAS